MQGHRLIRNAAALLASQPVTWVLTLVFTVMVPRNVGPVEWGEWGVAQALGGLAIVLFDMGINTVVVKSVGRNPERAESTVGVALTLRLLLCPVIVVAMLGFSFVGGYSAHTRLLIVLSAMTAAASSLALTAAYGLQAFERMHLCALASVLTSVFLTTGAVVMVKLLALGVISIGALALGAQLISLVLQLVWLDRLVRIRPVIDFRVVAQLVRDGLSYWVTRGIVTVYGWLPVVLISLLGATQENGWYGVALQLVSLPGFLIYAVTTAVFPSLSRGLVHGSDESIEVVGRCFRLLVTLSLPMAVGLALVSGNLVAVLYGAWFAPASQVLLVMSLIIPPVFVATLVGTFLIAADREVQWTLAMAVLCAGNLGLNLLTIPFFHVHFGNGGLGAALTLAATDTASGIIALVLLPASLRAAVRASARSILAAAPATLIMAAIVWPLRQLFLPIPVLAGILTFVVVALLLRVFPRDEMQALTSPLRRVALRLHPALAPAILPVAEAAQPVIDTARTQSDSEVA